MEINTLKTKNNFHNYIVIKQSDNTSLIELLLCGPDGSIMNNLNQSCTLTILDEVDKMIRQKTKEQIINGTITFKVTNDLKTHPHTLEVTTADGQKFPSNNDFTILVSDTHDKSELNVINNLSRDEALAEINQSVKEFISKNTSEYVDKVATSEWLKDNKFKPKEAVTSFSELPKNAELKEIRLVQDANKQYIFEGVNWIEFGAVNLDGLTPLKNDIATSHINAKYPPLSSGLTQAKGDGVTDDHAALQKMITYCEDNNVALYLPSGNYYISKNLKTKQMTSYNYRNGVRIYGNGKDTIITRNAGKIPADYSNKEGLHAQAALSIYGANNIVEDVSFNDCQIGIYLGQDPNTTTQLSASMNRMKNVWMEYVGTGLQFTHGAGNHYNNFENFHIIHSQISVDLGEGFFINQFNNNRNVFTNFRVARTWIGFLLRQTDGNFFNNCFAETLQGDGAIGDAPKFLPSELNGKKTFIVALDGQYNVFSNYGAEAVEWYIYSVGFRNSFINGMTKDDSVATNKVMFPNSSRQPLVYSANSTMIAGLVQQNEAGIFFPGSNGIGLQAPYRIFDIGYHRQSVPLNTLSAQIAAVTSASVSKAHRLGREVKWSTHSRFNVSFGTSNQYEIRELKIKLPFSETPENTNINEITTGYTKPFVVFVGSSNGATEIVSARMSTASEATSYGSYHLIVSPPKLGWRTDAQVNYLAFDITWNV
ncbi:glycosyl hydrolase family 28-related protein [Macrococcoides caseolyticum]|uniref:glycosyl hydrolase family 28-related protein n=1 Tax=Macrococcoides caseolyticum TaxID=69966 RepID=UPI0024BC77A4|nr:glycosyl hydrolase family 28-related protein [Macrococcus caseolyticus]MDJ1088065.1 glycosyl hydrolase family 28-related protein [Macrococcus caseolyticus]